MLGGAVEWWGGDEDDDDDDNDDLGEVLDSGVSWLGEEEDEEMVVGGVSCAGSEEEEEDACCGFVTGSRAIVRVAWPRRFQIEISALEGLAIGVVREVLMSSLRNGVLSWTNSPIVPGTGSEWTFLGTSSGFTPQEMGLPADALPLKAEVFWKFSALNSSCQRERVLILALKGSKIEGISLPICGFLVSILLNRFAPGARAVTLDKVSASWTKNLV